MAQKHDPVCSPISERHRRKQASMDTCLPVCSEPCSSELFVLSIAAGTLLHLEGRAVHLAVQGAPAARSSPLSPTPQATTALGSSCLARLACRGHSSVQWSPLTPARYAPAGQRSPLQITIFLTILLSPCRMFPMKRFLPITSFHPCHVL